MKLKAKIKISFISLYVLSYSKASIHEYAILPEHAFFPLSAIVKPMLEDRADRKASMPDVRNEEKSPAIPRV